MQPIFLFRSEKKTEWGDISHLFVQPSFILSVCWPYNTPFVLRVRQISIEKDGNSYFSALEITSVAVEDAGKYKVTAKNELGESNATISLNFDSKFLLLKAKVVVESLLRRNDSIL